MTRTPNTHTCIRFLSPPNLRGRRLSWWKRSIITFLKIVLPNANPDFENRLNEVSQWLVEFETDTEIPTREIGVNGSGQAIIIMPFKKNYGFWTDSHLLLKDFKMQFQPEIITQQAFDELWNNFHKK